MRAAVALPLLLYGCCSSTAALPAITEFTFRADIARAELAGDEDPALLVLTTEGALFVSSESDRSFKQSVLDCPSSYAPPRDFVVNGYDHDVVVVLGGKCSWVSDSSGDVWRAFELPAPPSRGPKWGVAVHEVMFHPYNSDAFIATSRSDACSRGAKGRGDEGECMTTAFVTRDLGTSFKVLRTHIGQIDWDSARDDGVKADSILAVVSRKRPHQAVIDDDDDDAFDVVQTADDFWTHRVLLPHATAFFVRESFVFAAQARWRRGGGGRKADDIELMVRSPELGREFVSARLPFKISQRQFSVLDTRFGHVFIHVRHGASPFGSVYSSDATGANYSLSLPYALLDAKARVDFAVVQGLEGAFVANIVSNADAVDGAGAGATPPVQLRTMLTVDQGREWTPLRAPSRACAGTCSLHLAGVTSVKGRVYSSEAAPGLVLAVGNEGDYLFDMHTGTNTYLSRDGGQSWELARAGSRVYELGNHGNIIVAADDVAATTRLEYTLDQGLNWTAVDFAKTPVRVHDIVAPAGETVLYLLGSRESSFGRGGAVWTLDFSKEHARACEGTEVGQLGGDVSDFEAWAPSNGRCVMGRKMEVVRRKRDAACFTDIDEGDTTELRFDCPCTAADYECSVGYVRDHDGVCVRDAAVDLNYTLAQPRFCPVGTSFDVSRGYRKLAGDSCTLADDDDDAVVAAMYEPAKVACKGRSVMGVGLRGWAVLLLFAALAVGVSRRDTKWRQRLADAAVRFGNRALGRFAYHDVRMVPDFSDNFATEFEWEDAGPRLQDDGEEDGDDV